MAPRLNFMTLSVDVKTLIVQHVSTFHTSSIGLQLERACQANTIM
jgi:hypothetical protein